MQDGWEQAKIHARAAVRRTATGMTAAQIEKATDEARIHERIRSRVCETEDDIRALGIAVAEHTEWRRIGYVMEEEGLEVYNPEHDPTAVRWAREEQTARREQAERARREQAESRGEARPGRADQPALAVVLDAETSRRLRACAAAQGTTPQRLAARVVRGVLPYGRPMTHATEPRPEAR
ncbi:hypothetical protein [Streptomyces megasporus]|uniref:hypothetical protein n=1 Tax=Streptomyces megasporus TaxID=44060 RepID=UPI00068E10A3|nr:hypothetical protein [Streptomyces megasporus]